MVDYVAGTLRHWTAIEAIAGDNISSGVTLEFIEDRGVFDKAMDIKKVGILKKL